MTKMKGKNKMTIMIEKSITGEAESTVSPVIYK